MISYLGRQLFGGLCVFIASILVHEAAHYLTAKKLGYQAFIKAERRPGKLLPDLVTYWNSRNKRADDNLIYAWGIIAGLVVIAVSSFFLDIWINLWLFFSYGWISMYDFKKMVKK